MRLLWTMGAAAIAATLGIGSFSYGQTSTPGEHGNQDATQAGASDGSGNTSVGNTMGGGMRGGMMGGGMMGSGVMGGRGDRYHQRIKQEQPDQRAHFVFRRGDALIDIRCPKDEELSVCVQGAVRLMREVKDMQSSGTSTQQ